MSNRIIFFLVSGFILLTAYSCTEASENGSFTMVLSGSVHGQLDPCG